MRYGLCVAAAAVALLAVPASAGPLSTELSSQGVYLEGPGVGVRVGPEHDRWRERDRRRHREGFRDREVRSGCKTVTVKERGPNGSMITRTKTNC
jgi:hypothetical protein